MSRPCCWSTSSCPLFWKHVKKFPDCKKDMWLSNITYVLTYLLTPWCRVLLEKLLVTKFPSHHGTRRFITALTSVHHLSLSWASPIQSIYTHPTSWRSVLIFLLKLQKTKVEVRGGAVCCGTAPQVGKPLVRFPMGLLGFFIELICLESTLPLI